MNPEKTFTFDHVKGMNCTQVSRLDFVVVVVVVVVVC